MIVQPQSLVPSYDLCVIGGGPAGIILALEYARNAPDKRVLLVEFANKRSSRNSLDDSIKNQNPVNHFDPYDCTNKGLGGSTASWGGRCVMYDPIDFVPHGPITERECTWDRSFFEDCQPYIARACELFHCGTGGFDLTESSVKVKPIAENFVEGDVTSTKLERWSLPTRFGPEYRSELAQSTSIHVLQGFEGRDFEVDEQGKSTALKLRSSEDGRQFTVHADNFVLANGSQEATRVLLRNTELFKTLSCPPNALGKYYQGHLSGKIANVRFSGDPHKTEYGYITFNDEALCRRRFQFSPPFIEREGLLNTAYWLDNLPVYDDRHCNGVLSLIFLIMILPGIKNRLLHAAMIRTLTNDQRTGIFKHLLNVIRGFPMSFLKVIEICFKRYLPRRKLPGIHLKSSQNLYALHFHSEQIPRSDSRMYLDRDNETLIIDYSYSDDEIELCLEAHRLLDRQLQQMNCGKLEYYYTSEEQLRQAIRTGSKDGLHQIGTTRIGKTVKEGVVDSDLKVFGTQNVYVCASSAFPTSGQANPTFFLGVCAVRLAKHLARKQGSA